VKNRAKCKLCLSIIESCHPTDLVVCKCGEIELNGGDAMYSRANDYNNFLRVDDLGNEKAVQYKRIDKPKESDDSVEDVPEELHSEEPLKYLERLLELDEEFLSKGHNQPMSRIEVIQYMRDIIKLFKRLSP
jgi:hypothetical protein